MNDAADHPWNPLASATIDTDPAAVPVAPLTIPEGDSHGGGEMSKGQIEPAAEHVETLDERMAAFLTEMQDRKAANLIASAALAQQDQDFQARAVFINFYLDDQHGTGGEISPEEWILGDGDEGDLQLPEAAIPEIMEAISPWLTHFSGIGLVRADGLEGALMGGVEVPTSQPTFYIVCAAGTAAAEVASLGQFEPVSLPIAALPGMSLTITSSVQPINATRLFEAMRDSTAQVGPWGGSAGSSALPEEGESREQFLTRVALSPDKAKRLVERWRRSGGDFKLFGLFGSAGERAAGNRPIEWVVPGLLLRGYITLLVGTKQSGKSTLIGEMAAVIDSECVGPRQVLGVEVTARGICCIVSGEDGDDFINARAQFYEATHGEALSMVVDTMVRPWAEVRQMILDLPELVCLFVDPLRAMLVGKEESSDAINTLLKELQEIARVKNCAVVLAHHLSKKTPRSFAAMLDAVRGSGAITDRPRVVLGMIDRGSDVTDIAVIKHNIPPGEPIWGETNIARQFRRDKATLTLIPVEQCERSAPGQPANGSMLTLILQSVEEYNRLALPVRRTGKTALFERRAPKIAGLSRSTVLSGIDDLLATGNLTDGPDGLHVGASRTNNCEGA